MRVWFDFTTSAGTPVRMSFAVDQSRPWAWRPFRPNVSVRTKQHTIFVRFANADGAVSTWHELSIP